MPPRPYILFEANYRQLKTYRPNVAILPWGATEAHNYHLPHGTDIIESAALAQRAAQLAFEAGAKPVVLPAIPFGNNAQQLDQVATISIETSTALAIVRDVAQSLKKQGIDRLIILNAHGGNEFKPIVRDVQSEIGVLIVIVNFYQLCVEEMNKIFEDDPGDHAGQMETSFLLHVHPEWVELQNAGPGDRVPFAVKGLNQAGVWTPRPWGASHPDTGSGNPKDATAEKGQRYVQTVAAAIAQVIIGLSNAKRGELPYM